MSSRVSAGFPPPLQPTWCGSGQSALAAAQQKPASSRATATATIVRRLPRSVSSRCQVRCRRCCAAQEIARTCGGWPAWRRLSASPLARRAAVVPGGFDQQPAAVPGPGLGDRALAALLARCVLRGNEAEVAHQERGTREAVKVADLRAEPDRAQRLDAAQAAQPCDRRSPRGVGNQLRDRRFERLATDQQRVDRADVVAQRDLRPALAEVDAGQPAAVMLRPGAGAALETTVVTQQQLGEPMAGTHQIAADVLAGTDQVTQRLLGGARNADQVQPTDHQQPQQPLRVTAIGLHPVARRPLDLPGRGHDTPDSGVLQGAREPEPGRAGLIGNPCRTRQPGAELEHLARGTRQPPHHELPGRAVHRRSDHLRRVHIQPRPAANLFHGRHSHDCGRGPGHS